MGFFFSGEGLYDMLFSPSTLTHTFSLEQNYIKLTASKSVRPKSISPLRLSQVVPTVALLVIFDNNSLCHR